MYIQNKEMNTRNRLPYQLGILHFSLNTQVPGLIQIHTIWTWWKGMLAHEQHSSSNLLLLQLASYFTKFTNAGRGWWPMSSFLLVSCCCCSWQATLQNLHMAEGDVGPWAAFSGKLLLLLLASYFTKSANGGRESQPVSSLLLADG